MRRLSVEHLGYECFFPRPRGQFEAQVRRQGSEKSGPADGVLWSGGKRRNISRKEFKRLEEEEVEEEEEEEGRKSRGMA